MPKYRTVEKNENAETAKRIFVIGAAFALSFGILAIRALSFHLKDNAELEKVAMRQYRTAVHQSSKRGKILDSSGRELAIDVTVDSAWADPGDVEDPVVLADLLSKILGIDRRKLFERLSSDRKFVWVKRRLSETESKAVADAGLKGIYSMRENSRSYPGGQLAANILGAVGFDSEPLGGVELAYSALLSASSTNSDMKRDARGHLYLSPSGGGTDASLADIELTIDRTLQYVTERELARGVARARAKGGSVVVVDVNSGAVLAIANSPTFDPNDYERFSLSDWKNRAISDTYEPGSTFKTIIVAAALDANAVTADEIFNCENGDMRIGDKIVHDAHPHGKLSVADIIKVSSNIGALKIEQRLGMQATDEAIRSFGFGRTSGIDLPGESAGILSPHKRWSDIQFATIAFGQGIGATPLQMAMAFAAIANGGTLLKPYVIKRAIGEGGATIFSNERQEIAKPIGAAAASQMTALLRRVVEKGGTGTLAASLEYPVAGKTGTAQKANHRGRGYMKGKYYASFVGFAPADSPRIAVYVGIDEPGGRMYYGGQVAAPIFREVVEATLHYLKVPGKIITAEAGAGEEDGQGPSSTAELALVEAAGREAKHVVQHDDQSWRIPDLTGLTMRGVLEASGHAEIAWRFTGSGVAVRQTPEPGSIVAAGAECEVEFRPLM